MEGTEALQIPAGFLQPQVFRNEIHQVKAILDLLDGILFHRRHGGKLTRSNFPRRRPQGPREGESRRPLYPSKLQTLPQASRWSYGEGSAFIRERISMRDQGGRYEASGHDWIGDRSPGVGVGGGLCQYDDG